MAETDDQDILSAAGQRQGKVVGVIIPPPEIRAVVDKTAQFVARNGKSFEQRILSSDEGKTAKFNFMKAYDPYHAYYEFKIREFEEGKDSIKPAPPALTTSSSTNTAGALQNQSKPLEKVTEAKATLMSPIARLSLTKPTEAPAPFEFSSGMPSGLSALDVDVIKLTAQFTAANGREFLGGLAQREQRNPQFDFLKPTHLLFSYFTSLVDAYAKILRPSEALSVLVKQKQTRSNALELAVRRWQWTRAEEERRRRESAELDAERVAFQSVDWFDFVVVETIDFESDEMMDYSPAALFQLDQQSQRALVEGSTSSSTLQAAIGVGGERRGQQDDDMDMDMGDDSDLTGGAGQPQKLQLAVASAAYDYAIEEDDSDIKVVSDYAPRLAPQIGLPGTGLTMVDPISGKELPIDEVGEHMRVQLLDPRWKIEHQRFREKQRDTGYAEGSSIADSLKQFARQRGDIFGGTTTTATSTSSSGNRGASNVRDRLVNFNEESVESVEVISSLAQTVPPPHFAVTAPPPPPAVLTSTALPMHVPLPVPVPAPVYLSQSIPISLAPIPMTMPVPLPTPIPLTSLPIPQAVASHQMVFPSTTPFIPAPPSLPPQASSMTAADSQPPATKRPRAEEKIVPAEEFASRYLPGQSITLTVQTVLDPSPNGQAWGLTGRMFTVCVSSVLVNVKALKEAVSMALQEQTQLELMPTNKQQLKLIASGVFLKDVNSLAAHNVGEGSIVELSIKKRG